MLLITRDKKAISGLVPQLRDNKVHQPGEPSGGGEHEEASYYEG
jgi:hypothetical protein